MTCWRRSSAFCQSLGAESVGVRADWRSIGDSRHFASRALSGYVSATEHILVDICCDLPKEWPNDTCVWTKLGSQDCRAYRPRHQFGVEMY